MRQEHGHIRRVQSDIEKEFHIGRGIGPCKNVIEYTQANMTLRLCKISPHVYTVIQDWKIIYPNYHKKWFQKCIPLTIIAQFKSCHAK
jgi:hypothetical protein